MQCTNYEHQAFKLLDRMPVLSVTLTQLLVCLNEEWVEYRKAAALIESDVVVTHYVLHLVNSAAFSNRKVTKIENAISLLGVRRLRNALLAFSITKQLNQLPPSADLNPRQFNKHSLAVAILADLLTCHIDITNAEDAFLAGLFHDFGQALIASGFPHEYHKILALHRLGVDLEEGEKQVLGFSHKRLSAAILRRSGFPEHAACAIEDAPTSSVENSLYSLSQVLTEADSLAKQLGYSVHTIPGEAPVDPSKAQISLPVNLPEVIVTFEQQFKDTTAAIGV